MKIIKKSDAIHVDKPEGTKVDYYLRNEYEVHYNEQVAGSTQTWHHHEKISETLFIIEGKLTAKWRENNEEKTQIVSAGDLIETENTSHTFINHTDKVVKFLVFKQVLSGQNKIELLKTDKVVD
ncbi:MAG: Cupin domain protein [Candidatus Woesebacteria bacterium GW2011_GWA1_33_30]|uniref:Cupin domain protein n=1 Tax=Candidatus Woesebacteria bacterium GW2011_GWA2_33_28 TaxID=1618561 RepID=A0A0G0AAN9_9BACT|nr:MAG: Cupin domain protein [Candidatus Woesebacteria bacterium GW2011_GWA2_33_28]KKP49138.1 MAG: Cupin domain protein [Candidatus Woesebacteria bacterium GW2011_GWA1_33_30]KKP50262.1 MAG: Cupin domain protein [Microgenomates group bacterium GW2011_GWC1_33_32]KKP52729.1 MAG: Cupin domain protein [Candidatus Woesebacteria bacterium GW2011_GWB1_33_38]KKP56583.1 MAG: Cupin domain protein [Microgenomates group bacterium GW2011_GWD1_33_9]